jgi:hypothetical protein
VLTLNTHTPFNSLELRHQGLIKQATDKYLTWLNEQSGEAYTYTAEEVVPIRVLLLIEDEALDDTIIHVYVAPDEGGGYATLHIHATREFEMVPTGNTIHSVYRQDYENTNPGGTNEVVKLDPPKETPVSGPEYRTQYKDTYELELVIQYFDGCYSIIYNATDTRFSNINR